MASKDVPAVRRQILSAKAMTVLPVRLPKCPPPPPPPPPLPLLCGGADFLRRRSMMGLKRRLPFFAGHRRSKSDWSSGVVASWNMPG